jgi:hypothetical protein
MSYKDTASGDISPKASATQVYFDGLNMVTYKKRATMAAFVANIIKHQYQLLIGVWELGFPAYYFKNGKARDSLCLSV